MSLQVEEVVEGWEVVAEVVDQEVDLEVPLTTTFIL